MHMAVEHGGALERPQQRHGLGTVRREPVPFALQVEQRTVRQHHDRGISTMRLEIGRQPFQLRRAQGALGIGRIVEGHEVDAFVIEALVELAEDLLESGAAIAAGIVLAGEIDMGLG